MRKAAIGLAILAILALAGLVAAPYLINLDYLKAEIAAKVQERTGRTLQIAGPIRLALLPTPAVDARDVRLTNPPGASLPDMVRLRAVEVKLAFWPLLAGRIDVRSAVLVDPDIDLERLPNGLWNWQASSGDAAHGAAAPTATAQQASSLSRLPLFVQDLVIQNGRVTYRSGGAVEPFEHINATLRLDGRQGPFRATGELVARGASLNVTVDGSVAGDEMPLHVAVSATPAAKFDFDGTASGAPGALKLAGSVKLSADDLAAAASTLARLPMPVALARPFTASAQLDASDKALTLDHLSLDLGTAHAEGRARYAWGAPASLTMSLRAASLDLDRWLAAKASAASDLAGPLVAGRDGPAASAAIPADRRAASANLILPSDLAARVTLSADAILWRGGILRQLQLQSSLAKGTVHVERLSALIPGSTDVTWKGTLATPQGTPHLDGHLDATSDNLRELLGWLGIGTSRVPPDRLRRASLSGDVALVGGQLDVSNVEGVLDATKLRAAAIIRLNQRLGIGLRVVADRLNLDAYLPQGTTPVSAAGTPPASAPSSAAQKHAPSFGVDVNLDARLQELTWRGQPLRDIHLAGVLQNDDLSLKELGVGDIGGATATLSGTVDDVSGNAFKGQIAFDAKGPELARVLQVIFRHAPQGQSFGAFTLDGAVQANDGKFALDSALQVLGGRLHAVGDVTLGTGGLNMGVDIDHPSAEKLLQAFYPTYHPAGGDPGALKFSTRITGAGKQYDFKNLSLTVGQSTLGGDLDVALGGARPKLTGALTFGDWAIDRLLPEHRTAAAAEEEQKFGLLPGIVLAQAGAAPPRGASTRHWSQTPFDLAFLQRIDAALTLKGHSLAYAPWRLDAPAMTVALQDGALNVERLSGQMFGGSLTAHGGVNAAPRPSLTFDAGLSGADLKAALAAAAGVAPLDGRFDLDASISGAGANQADLMAHLDGHATLKSRDGTLSGVDLKAADDRIKSLNRPTDLLGLFKAVTGGTTHFSALDGTFTLKNGVATTDDLHLVAEGGEGRSTTTIDLPHWTIASRIGFDLTGVPGMPPLVMHLDGPLDDPKKVFDVNALSQFLAQRLSGKAAAQDGKAAGGGAVPAQESKDTFLRDVLKGLTPHP